MKWRFFTILIGAAAFLPGCSTFDEISEVVDSVFDDTVEVFTPFEDTTSCEERTSRQIAEVSFIDAAPIEMVVRHGEFTPMIIRMHVGQTYVLRLRNRDQESRSFAAPEFFDAIAIAAAAIDNDLLDTRCPGPVIHLESGQSFEMKLLAVRDGRYDYRDGIGSILDIGNIFNSVPTGGIIRIEERY